MRKVKRATADAAGIPRPAGTMRALFPLLAAVLLLAGCREKTALRPMETAPGGLFRHIATDKARYAPGEPVLFRVELAEEAGPGDLIVRYVHLAETVGERKIGTAGGAGRIEWEWTPPDEDFRGYLVEVYAVRDGRLLDQINIAVDVSSDWSRFPRYGYLADFPEMDEAEQERIIERLNRFRINGIQFYDWQYKHHQPIKWREDGRPADSWPDIANRTVSFATVSRYIDMAHERNMMAMNYNLLFGAYEDADRDGVSPAWGLYADPLGQNQDRHPLPDGWASDILLYDPSNPDWQAWLFGQEKKVFDALPFDGWHVDQLGDRGARWNAAGEPVRLAETYPDFLANAREALGVELVMNAVGQFGQPLIAKKAPVSFLYTEVWDGHPHYGHLKQIIDKNRASSGGRLATVLAAYVNYSLADRPGTFNAPGVLLANAVIFASGGAHLEVGENLLAKEYFPNRNLTVPPELEKRLLHYYDFLTAYQNVLRDGWEETDKAVAATDPDVSVSRKAERGKVWQFAKTDGRKTAIHLINFRDAVHMAWNDAFGNETEPEEITGLELVIGHDAEAAKVWAASPDRFGGSAEELSFEQEDGRLVVRLPSLKIWSMIVIEDKP